MWKSSLFFKGSLQMTEFPPFFYERSIKRVTSYQYIDFLKTLDLLKTKGEDIDINGSIFTTKFSIRYKNGDFKCYYAWYEMFARLEEDLGIEIDLKLSTSSMSTFTLFLKNDVDLDALYLASKGESLPEQDIDTPISNNPLLESTIDTGISNDAITSPTIDVDDTTTESDLLPGNGGIVNLVQEEGETRPVEEEVDYEFLNSFLDESNMKGSKKKLEQYVSRVYGIDLRRNKTFENMIKELKDTLAK